MSGVKGTFRFPDCVQIHFLRERPKKYIFKEEEEEEAQGIHRYI